MEGAGSCKEVSQGTGETGKLCEETLPSGVGGTCHGAEPDMQPVLTLGQEVQVLPHRQQKDYFAQ